MHPIPSRQPSISRFSPQTDLRSETPSSSADASSETPAARNGSFYFVQFSRLSAWFKSKKQTQAEDLKNLLESIDDLSLLHITRLPHSVCTLQN